MTERDEHEGDEQRPKVRIVDKRRYREGDDAPAEAGASSPDATGLARGASRPSQPEGELAHAKAEAAEYRDHLQRLQAEFENYRKRMTRSQERLVDAELQRFVQGLLEVLDEFDLALMAAERQPDFEAFRKGVELVLSLIHI